MPDGKPDPNCKECRGTGQILLLTSSCECDCVNRKSVFAGIHDIKILPKNPYYSTTITTPQEPVEKKSLVDAREAIHEFEKIIRGIEKLHLSADYIAKGIATWCMWPGIEGHTCDGCGATMNVLGMSYNHWCPMCDPDEKEYVCKSFSRCGGFAHDYPTFGPSIDTIREAGRIVDAQNTHLLHDINTK